MTTTPRIHILLLLLTAFCLTATTTMAKGSNKWYKRARKAQVNVLTYDASGQLLHSTNGFLVGDRGTLISDYHSFVGAARAAVVTERGTECAVTSIDGGNSLYDIVRAQVAMPKPSGLNAGTALQGEPVFIMPHLNSRVGFATESEVSQVAAFDSIYSYYTLPTGMTDIAASCPVMNARGEVIGLLQMAARDADSQCYALDVRYAMNLRTTAWSATDNDLAKILIRKTLPATEHEATNFLLYMQLFGRSDAATLMGYADDFIATYPALPTGYTTKADVLVGTGRYAEADTVWQQAIAAHAPQDAILAERSSNMYRLVLAATDSLPSTWTLQTALDDIRQAIAIKPEAAYSLQEAKLLYAIKDYTSAASLFTELAQGPLRSADNFLYAAQCHQMLGDTTAVLALQDSAVALFTKPYPKEAATALLMRSQTLTAVGRDRDAVRDMLDYERLAPADVTANFYHLRAQAAMRCRMFPQAVSDMERAVRMAPDDALYPAQLAGLLYRFGHLDEAIAAAQQAVAIDDEFADAHRILGVCLRDAGRTQESRLHLLRAAELGDAMAKEMLDR